MLSGQDCHANDRSAPADSPQPDDSLRPRNRPPGLSCPGSFSEVPCLSTGRGTRALPPEKKWNHWGEPWVVDSESPSCDRMRSFSRTVMEKPSSAEGQALYSACKWERNIRRGALAMEPMVQITGARKMGFHGTPYYARTNVVKPYLFPHFPPPLYLKPIKSADIFLL